MNMHYCRFYNTYIDFSECLTAIIEQEKLSYEESRHAEKLYEAAKEYIKVYELYNDEKY